MQILFEKNEETSNNMSWDIDINELNGHIAKEKKKSK